MTGGFERSRRQERRAEQARARRQERHRRAQTRRRDQRLTRIGLFLAAALLGIGLVYGVYSVITDWRASRPPEGVVSAQNVQTGHSNDPVDYGEGLPPVGGAHSGSGVQPGGYYDIPVASELAVHSLEYGAIWFTYLPDVPEEQVQRLRNLAVQSEVLVSPYPGQPSPIVATAWAKQVMFDAADDPDLAQFIRAFKGARGEAPEPNAPC